MLTEKQLAKMYRDAGHDPKPYIEANRKAHAYQDQYYEDHSACPKCGYEGHSSTYMGYVLVIDLKETYKKYKDENYVQCGKCGWRGRTHDLVKKPLKVGDRIKITAIPGEGDPSYTLHKDTRWVYKTLIARGRPVRISEVDAEGTPWFTCRFKLKNGKWRTDFLSVMKDDTNWVLVKPRRNK